MNTKILAAIAVGAGLLLVAGAASADDIVPPPPPEPDPDDNSDAVPDDDDGGGGGGVPPNPDPPPNLTGDPAGYNTVMFPGGVAVRQWLVNLGYGVNVFTDAALKNNRKVKKFQRDYNDVASNTPSMGTLYVDGTAGVNTLRAIEIAYAQTATKSKSWNMIVRGA